MAQFTEIGVVALVEGLGTFNGGMSIMRRQMGLTGSSARSFSNTFNGSMKGLGQSVLNAGRTVRSFGNELTFLGFQLTFLATGAFAAVTAAGSEFESTIVRMATLADAATSELGELANTAQTLGPALGTGPTEMADAMFDIVSSGFSAADAMSIIEHTSKGAAIGLGTVREVTDAVTSAMRAFAKDGLSASRATDILVAAVREGKGEVDALAGTIGRVLGIAGELGVTFEETAAFIATFTRVGVPAEVAVTSLRSALTNILKPTQAAEDALAKYELTMADIKSIIQERGLLQALVFLAETMEGDEEAMGRVIGSARALAGVLINTGPLVQDYNDVLATIEGTAGITADAFDLFAQTTEFKINRVKASFESLAITVSNTMRPIINAILDFVPRVTTAIEELIQQNPKLFLLVGGFAAIAAAAGPLLIIAGLMITSVGTLISVFGALGVAIGSILSPIGLVVGGLATLAATITGLFIASFEKTREKLAAQGRSISFDAYAWGRNIVVQFARGMAAAVVYIIQVLTRIGQIIRSLLKPGSPPKLLPDLDKWGAGAMQAYMDGWLDADFGVFQTIAQRIESFFRTLDIAEIDIVPAILGIRLELAKLIEQFSETGKVSTEVIKNISLAFGDASAVVEQYIRAMLRLESANKAVERAQQALNDVQEKYRRMLDPIQDELDEIAARRQEVIDQQREEELQSIIDDPNAPALAKELALMELREIALKRQQRAIEDQRDADVDAAEERLNAAEAEQRAAEARLKALEQFIAVQEKNNQLIAEQIELLKRLAESVGGADGGGGIDTPREEDLGLGDIPVGGDFDIDEALGKDFTDEVDMFRRKIGGMFGPEEFLDPEGFGSLEGLFGDIDQAAQDLVVSMQGIGTEIASAWQPVIDAGEGLTDVWSDIFSLESIEGSPLMEFVNTIGDIIDDNNLREFVGNFDPIAQILERIGEVAPFVLIAAGAVERFVDAFIGAFEELGDDESPLIGLKEVQDIMEGWDTLPEIFDALLDPIALVVIGVSSLIAGVAALGVVILEWIPRAAETWDEKVTAMNTKLENFISESLGFIGEWAVSFLQWITGTGDKSEKRLGKMSKDGQGFVETLKDKAIEFVKDMFNNIPTILSNLFDSVVGGEGWLTKIKKDGVDLFGDLRDGAEEKVGEILGKVDAKFQELIGWIQGQVELFKEAGRNIGQGLLEGIQEKVQPLIDFIENLIQQLIGATEDETEESSPSKVFMRIGQFLMDGLLIGMQQRAMAVENGMRQIIANGIAAAQEEEMALAMSAAAGASNVGSRGGWGTSAHPDQGSAGYYYSNRESSFGPINIYDGLDIMALRALVRQEMGNAF